MNLLIITVASLSVIVCLLLTGMILLQNPKDEAGYTMGSFGIQQVVGVAHMAHLVEKVTYFLAALLVALILLLSFLLKQQHAERSESSVLQEVAAHTVVQDAGEGEGES